MIFPIYSGHNLISIFPEKMKFKSKSPWKSIPMPHSLFGTGNDSAMCGGIEVLEDYTLNQKKGIVSGKEDRKEIKRKIHVNHEKGAKKARNTFNEVDIETSKKSQGTKMPAEEKQNTKKKKKRTKSKNKPAINMDLFKTLNHTTEGATEKEEGPANLKTAVKKQKNKKKEVPCPQESKDVKKPALQESDMSEWREIFVCEEIIKNLQLKGFSSPTPIQKLTLPAAINGKILLFIPCFDIYTIHMR